MSLKDNGEGYMGGLEGGKGRGVLKLCCKLNKTKQNKKPKDHLSIETFLKTFQS